MEIFGTTTTHVTEDVVRLLPGNCPQDKVTLLQNFLHSCYPGVKVSLVQDKIPLIQCGWVTVLKVHKLLQDWTYWREKDMVLSRLRDFSAAHLQTPPHAIEACLQNRSPHPSQYGFNINSIAALSGRCNRFPEPHNKTNFPPGRAYANDLNARYYTSPGNVRAENREPLPEKVAGNNQNRELKEMTKTVDTPPSNEHKSHSEPSANPPGVTIKKEPEDSNSDTINANNDTVNAPENVSVDGQESFQIQLADSGREVSTSDLEECYEESRTSTTSAGASIKSEPADTEMQEDEFTDCLWSKEHTDLFYEQFSGQGLDDGIDGAELAEQGQEGTPSSSQVYACQECSYVAPKPEFLKYHMRRLHEAKKFQCSVCGKAFGLRKDLKRHSKIHSAATEDCPFCDKTLKNIFCLKAHLRGVHNTHDFSFEKDDDLEEMSRTDVYLKSIKGTTGPFTCLECDYVTQKVEFLKLHIQRLHDTKKFKCNICGKGFGLQKDINRHMLTHSEAEKQCTLCGKRLKNRLRLRIHLRTVHDRVDLLPADDMSELDYQDIGGDSATNAIFVDDGESLDKDCVAIDLDDERPKLDVVEGINPEAVAERSPVKPADTKQSVHEPLAENPNNGNNVGEQKENNENMLQTNQDGILSGEFNVTSQNDAPFGDGSSRLESAESGQHQIPNMRESDNGILPTPKRLRQDAVNLSYDPEDNRMKPYCASPEGNSMKSDPKNGSRVSDGAQSEIAFGKIRDSAHASLEGQQALDTSSPGTGETRFMQYLKLFKTKNTAPISGREIDLDQPAQRTGISHCRSDSQKNLLEEEEAHYISFSERFKAGKCSTPSKPRDLAETQVTPGKLNLSPNAVGRKQPLEPGEGSSSPFTKFQQSAKGRPLSEPEGDEANMASVEAAGSGSYSEEVEARETLTYPCHICEYGAKSSKVLRLHMQRHYGEGEFFCSQCGKFFRLQKDYKRHWEYHQNPPESCPLCSKKLKNKFCLKAHLKNIHKLDQSGSGGTM